MTNKLKEAALRYNELGFSVIPLYPNDKVPMVNEWQKYCKTKSTREEIEAWWLNEPSANIGIACGPANKKFLFVVDQDVSKDDLKEHGDISGCPPTLSQTTGSGGRHLLYWAPTGQTIRNSKPRTLVDIRGEGGQIMVSPSIHPNGKEYTWDTGDFRSEEITDFPLKDLQKLLGDNERNGKLPVNTVLAGLPVGRGIRHFGIAQVAGFYLRNVKTQEEIELALSAVNTWDREFNQSPEPAHVRQKEIANVFNGILKKELSKRELEPEIGVTKLEPKLWSIGDILSHDFGTEEWLVDSLISKQGMTALSGNPGDYKTWVTIHIALCICRNIPVFSKYTAQQGAVLIVDEEDHLRLLKKRLESLGAKETDSIHYLSQNGIKMDDEYTRDKILEIVKEKNIKLLILDSLVRVHGQDENDAKGMAKVFSGLQKIIAAGASVLFTHHHRKQTGFQSGSTGQSMRGSSDILAAVDCHISIEKKKDEPNKVIIKQTKLRQAELLQPFEVNILIGDLGPSGFEYAGGYDEKKKKVAEVAEALPLLLEEGIKSRKEIIDLLAEEGFGKTVVEEGIKLAEEGEKIERVPKDELDKKDRKKAYYRLPQGSIPNNNEIKAEINLPATNDPIENGKQEDVYDDWFSGRHEELSICCKAPMSGGVQCLTCGADGRKSD